MANLTFSNLSHVQFHTRDLKRTLTFFKDVLGLPLRSIDWLGEDREAVRATMGLSDGSSLSFLWSPAVPDLVAFGTTHATDPAGLCTRGTLQHVAFNAKTMEDLLALRDRIRSHGVHCAGPLNHGFCHSIYFGGPEEMILEVAVHNDVEMHRWIEPSVVEALGLSEQGVDALRNPAPFESPQEPVKNVPLEASQQHRLVYSDDRYAALYAQSD